MAEFRMPSLGADMEAGTLVEWKVKPGDAVEADQPVADLMTDKATVTIPCPVAGTVETLLAKEGQVVAVGAPIVVVVVVVTGVVVDDDVEVLVEEVELLVDEVVVASTEVLVVDDGSQDGSAEVARRLPIVLAGGLMQAAHKTGQGTPPDLSDLFSGFGQCVGSLVVAGALVLLAS